MPRLSCWFGRAALVYLACGLTFGALLLANKGVPFAAWVWRLLPLHIELLLNGWLLQLAMGVAFWILPRFGQGSSRGREWLAWTAWGLVNLGILLAAAGSLGASSWLTMMGGALKLAGVASFVVGSWRRVKPFGA